MLTGIPMERKVEKTRVALTPGGVEILYCAFLGSEFSDTDYENFGATIVDSSTVLMQRSEMNLHVKTNDACESCL